MTTLDIFILIFILFGAFGGFKEGLIMTLFSLVAIILGVLGGFKLMGLGILFLQNHMEVDAKWLPYIAFGIMFVLIVITVNLVGRIIRAGVQRTPLGIFDKIFGACVGVLRTAFMLSVVIWLLDSLQIHFPEGWTTNSLLYPLTAHFAPMVTHWIGRLIPAFRDIFDF